MVSCCASWLLEDILGPIFRFMKSRAAKEIRNTLDATLDYIQWLRLYLNTVMLHYVVK